MDSHSQPPRISSIQKSQRLLREALTELQSLNPQPSNPWLRDLTLITQELDLLLARSPQNIP